MIKLFFRGVLSGLLAFATLAAWGSVDVVPLAPADPHVNLGERMSMLRLDAARTLDADVLWAGPAADPATAQPVWRLQAGQRLVGRITLRGNAVRDTYVVQVPAPSVDKVHFWHREAGGPWQQATAGDRVPLSLWPFATQYPAFPIAVGLAPMDLIVAVENAGPLGVAVSVLPDAAYRESHTRSASLSGMIMGLGAMVALVCLLGALNQRRRAHWVLAGVSGFTLFTAACLNGYMAVWFTPEAAAFNDASKPFAGVVLGGLLVAATAESLDSRYRHWVERAISLAVPLLCLAWAGVQALWLPESWRAPGTAACALLTTASCIALCVMSAMRGGRRVALVGGGVACITLVWVTVTVFRDFTGGPDIRSALVGLLLYATLLLFRQALILRDRYGRDVLGRAGVSANRDPLTALLSYAGFEQAYDEALLRQAAGAQSTSMMLFVLPKLDESWVDYGFVVTERSLVRFAAALQSALGNSWSIARLSQTRFACISTQPYNAREVGEYATRVLARCGRMSRPLAPIADFDLRIACLHRPVESEALGRTLKELERAALAMTPGKHITVV